LFFQSLGYGSVGGLYIDDVTTEDVMNVVFVEPKDGVGQKWHFSGKSVNEL